MLICYCYIIYIYYRIENNYYIMCTIILLMELQFNNYSIIHHTRIKLLKKRTLYFLFFFY